MMNQNKPRASAPEVSIFRRTLGFVVGVYLGYLLMWIAGQGSLPKPTWFQLLNALGYGLAGYCYILATRSSPFSWRGAVLHSLAWAGVVGFGFGTLELMSGSQPSWDFVRQTLKIFFCALCAILISSNPNVFKRL